MNVSVDSSGPTSDPIPPRTPPHHHPIPTSGPLPTTVPAPTANSAQTHERPDPYHQEIRAFGRSGRGSAVVGGLLLLLLSPPPDGVRLDVLEGAAAALGHPEGDEQDAEDADDAEDRE